MMNAPDEGGGSDGPVCLQEQSIIAQQGPIFLQVLAASSPTDVIDQ